MKRIIVLIIISLLTCSIFAQTKVDAKKLGKTLETNKNAEAVFTCDISLSGIQVSNDGTVTLPSLAKNKIKIVSGMDMTNLKERLNYANKKTYIVTLEVYDLLSKTYTLTKIDGIETINQYKERILEEQKAEARKNIMKFPIQVVNQEIINISGAEYSWLPGQVQDKLKSNLQEYLGMKTVVDSKSEAALKKLQAESEDGGRDESTAIELGKITTAKFAVFTKLRKTGTGYTISIDFTDLTTGEQMASCTSKEYSKAEYLYGSTGAVDELTLTLANKLNINISELNKNLLTSGSANFSVDAQLALAKQNEEQYQKMMKDYDAELSKLMTSNDINAIQNKNRIEAEKALLVEKQNAEKKRLEELKAQMARAAEDEKLEAERSIALKTQRDKMAKDAAEKAEEVRKLKMEKQGVLGQINVIESKKKALVEIRQGVESRAKELYEQLENDRKNEKSRIRNKTYSTVELGSNGKPTEQALQRRENQVIKSYEDLTNKFFADCEAVKKATASQDSALLTEIRADQKTLSKTRTVSSLGDELKVSYGKYEGSKNGWNAYLSLYSDGILLFKDNFIVNYEALSGKKAPDMTTELRDDVIEEYANNVDMYNSLLIRGDPIIYFEIDYNVTAEDDDKPGEYKFNFSKIRVINTVSGKITQTSNLNKVMPRTMKPEWDLREFAGICEKEKAKFNPEKYTLEVCMINDMDLKTAKVVSKKIEKINTLINNCGSKIVVIPGESFLMLNTEVTQKLYSLIMGENPSRYKSEMNPVEYVTWYESIIFCNKLSEKIGLTPVYSVNGITDVNKWKYSQYTPNAIAGEIEKNDAANGFRLPTNEEWMNAEKGGLSISFYYRNRNNINEIGWYEENSNSNSHLVAQKKANEYKLYDMNGNVMEWVWDIYSKNQRKCVGGSYTNSKDNLNPNLYWTHYPESKYSNLGFRIVCSTYN